MTPAESDPRYDFIIVGGGFYGCALALHLRRRGLRKILLVEREAELLTRASYTNQARVHNGYHYPRSFVTAHRSRVNFDRFCEDFAFAIKTDFVKLYAIADRNSRVSAAQFERFMTDIGAPFERAPPEYRKLFEPRLIEAVYVTQEYAFNALQLRSHFERELAKAEIEVWRGTEAVGFQGYEGLIQVLLRLPDGERRILSGGLLNCTYGRVNSTVPCPTGLTPLKHEVTEMALVTPPAALQSIGITVMDGPFFSFMPFPAEAGHTLSHVRYTPHGSFVDRDGSRDPLSELSRVTPESRAHFMIADAARYVPLLEHCEIRRSLFEVKTVLVRNEVDDGRPILLRREPIHDRAFSILGGKIDNIYDIAEQLDAVLSPSG